MLRQLGRTAVAILDMHHAAGDAHRAEQIAAVMRTHIAAVRETLPAVTTNQRSVTDTQDSRAGEAVRVATGGNVRAGYGSPMPTKLDPVRPVTPIVPQERDGTGRE